MTEQTPSPISREMPRFNDDHLAYLLDRASALIDAQFAIALRQRGMLAATWRVLSTLSDTDGLSITALADATLLKQPTLTKVVDRMNVQGLVERRRSDRDYRKALVFMTPQGREQAAALLGQATQLERQALAGLSEADVARVKAALRAVIAHCSAPGRRRR